MNFFKIEKEISITDRISNIGKNEAHPLYKDALKVSELFKKLFIEHEDQLQFGNNLFFFPRITLDETHIKDNTLFIQDTCFLAYAVLNNLSFMIGGHEHKWWEDSQKIITPELYPGEKSVYYCFSYENETWKKEAHEFGKGIKKRVKCTITH